MVQKRVAAMIWPGIIQRDVLGIRFAINVFIGSTITWYTLSRVADTNPIWAIASMIAASDPEVVEAARMFRCRITNVLVGCAVGLLVLVIGGSSEWKLPITRTDRKSTRLNSSHIQKSRMPSSA